MPLAVIRRALLVATMLFAGLYASPGAYERSLRVYLATQSSTFNLVDWELQQVAARGAPILGSLFQQPRTDPDDVAFIRQYLAEPLSRRTEQRHDVERALERELGEIIRLAGIERPVPLPVTGVFPPVAFRLTSPPSVLIVAPRDRLIVAQSLFLQPGVDAAEAQGIEERVDALTVSSLVTPIGGLGTYPSMVVESGRSGDLLASIAHEWLHAYLFFRPLGASYWTSQEGRSINETVADLGGRELGRMLAQRLGVSPPTEPERGGSDQVFRREMRATRVEVERLLAQGAVDQAETYMEQRRLDLEAIGYRIRKLNQAYFAFHGSYAESVAGDDSLAAMVRDLRARSPDLSSFLQRISGVQSLDELRRLLASV